MHVTEALSRLEEREGAERLAVASVCCHILPQMLPTGRMRASLWKTRSGTAGRTYDGRAAQSFLMLRASQPFLEVYQAVQ